jgi:hypothetical protein
LVGGGSATNRADHAYGVFAPDRLLEARSAVNRKSQRPSGDQPAPISPPIVPSARTVSDCPAVVSAGRPKSNVGE